MFSIKINFSNHVKTQDIVEVYEKILGKLEYHNIQLKNNMVLAEPLKGKLSLYHNSFRLSIRLYFNDAENGSQLIGVFSLEKSVKRFFCCVFLLLSFFLLLGFFKQPEVVFKVFPIFGGVAVFFLCYVCLCFFISVLYYRNKIKTLINATLSGDGGVIEGE